ncbi:uncharacterized protein F4812DRAFT_467296 [Daldinia caldariorum]|uniref:uncharacterized protein n=1 Tax=Daldinia caldariorum TaxID=326644 RepID=UPI0020085B6F|nr:uncharacterized protein F4812DRAFT_467296 [Daldinia caldariorum]KAI1471082.1 hypothetical protein F4812DRAFT_467296 [Daldinia caldariorum]
MSIFCCYRPRRTVSQEPVQDTIELPTRPPRVKLPNPPFPPSGAQLSSPEVVIKKTPPLPHHQIPEATVDPIILEIEDSDDDEPVRSTRNSSTGTLGAIRTRFIRRLSQKSESRRHSQLSLGTSDEEIARRAELRRLMRKRIQEELKNEEEREDAKVKAGNTEEPKPDGTTNIELPRGGPRDNIEFCVLDVNETSPQDNTCGTPDVLLLALSASNSQPGISLRRCSYPGSSPISRAHEDAVTDDRGVVKERGPLPRFPSSPQLTPVHVPSARVSESLCSWRLSYSAEQLARYIGIPEPVKPEGTYEPAELNTRGDIVDRQGECVNPRHSDFVGTQELSTSKELYENATRDKLAVGKTQQQIQSDEENSESMYSAGPDDTSSNYDSPLDIWLRSQELQSTSATPSRKTSNIVRPVISKAPGVIEPQETSGELVIMQHGSLEVKLGKPSAGLNVGQVGEPSDWATNSIRRRSDAFDGRDLVLTNQGQKASSSLYTPSRYSTRPNSCQTATKGSRLNLTEFLGGRKTVAPFLGLNRLKSSSRATDAEKSEVSSYKTAPNDASTVEINMPGAQQLQRPTADINSAAVSDTASFRQRESELKSIEKRFGRTNLRRDTITPMASKFREEFNEPRTRTSIISKNSILAKFHLPIAKRTKYQAQDAPHHSVQVVKCSGATNQDTEYACLGQQNPHQVAANRQQIVLFPKLEHEDVANSRGSQPQISVFHEDASGIQWQEESLSGSLGYHKTTHIDQALHLRTRKEHGSSLKPLSRHENNSSRQSDLSSTVLREWVSLLNDQDLKSQEELKAETQSHGTWRFRTPPASWAKWPSHTRQQRTGPAGEEDNVISRDFAVRVESNGSDITWLTDKPGNSFKKKASPRRSLSTQLGRAVKGGFSRVVQNTINRPSSEAYRARQKPDKGLEYPELKILPIQGGYEDLQALEQQIGTMKRGTTTTENQLASSSVDNTRPPLSARFAEEVHMIQHQVPTDGSQDNETTVQNSAIICTSTPDQARPASPRISETASQSRGLGSCDSGEPHEPHELEQRPEDKLPADNNTTTTATEDTHDISVA